MILTHFPKLFIIIYIYLYSLSLLHTCTDNFIYRIFPLFLKLFVLVLHKPFFAFDQTFQGPLTAVAKIPTLLVLVISAPAGTH